MSNAQILVYAFSCVDCTSPMFLFLFLQHPHHRDAFGANSGSLGLLGTFRVGESPLKLTCIIRCTPGFYSTEFKLQKQGRTVMFILLANFGKAWLKRFQVTGSFIIAHASWPIPCLRVLLRSLHFCHVLLYVPTISTPRRPIRG